MKRAILMLLLSTAALASASSFAPVTVSLGGEDAVSTGSRTECNSRNDGYQTTTSCQTIPTRQRVIHAHIKSTAGESDFLLVPIGFWTLPPALRGTYQGEISGQRVRVFSVGRRFEYRIISIGGGQ